MNSALPSLLGVAVFLLVIIFAITPAVLRKRQDYVNNRQISAVARHYRVSQWMDFSPDQDAPKPCTWLEFLKPYMIPMLVFMLVVYACSYVAFLAATSDLNLGRGIFLTGGKVFADSDAAHTYVSGTLIAIVAAFYGSFVWAAGYIYRRLASYDLAPITYYQVTLRIISAVMVAVVIRYALAITELNGASGRVELIALAAFVAGLDPSIGINWIRRLANKYVFKEERKADDTVAAIGKLPVQVIDGLSPYIKTRLEEFEIDDVQNLGSIRVSQPMNYDKYAVS